MLHVLNHWRSYKRVNKTDADLTEYWGMTIYDDKEDIVYNIIRGLTQGNGKK